MKVLHLGVRWHLLGASPPVLPQSLPLSRESHVPGRCWSSQTVQITYSSMTTLHLLCVPRFPLWATSCVSSPGKPHASLLPSSSVHFWAIHFPTIYYAEKGISPLGSRVIHSPHGSKISLFFLQHPQIFSEGLPCSRPCLDGENVDSLCALTGLVFYSERRINRNLKWHWVSWWQNIQFFFCLTFPACCEPEKVLVNLAWASVATE